MITTIKANKIGLMIVEPFVASHRVIENDNLAVELVTGAWADVADETGARSSMCTTRAKPVAPRLRSTTAALFAKVRSARTLNGMSEDEAARAGVERRR